jgi:hypothetical protein
VPSTFITADAPASIHRLFPLMASLAVGSLNDVALVALSITGKRRPHQGQSPGREFGRKPALTPHQRGEALARRARPARQSIRYAAIRYATIVMLPRSNLRLKRAGREDSATTSGPFPQTAVASVRGGLHRR